MRNRIAEGAHRLGLVLAAPVLAAALACAVYSGISWVHEIQASKELATYPRWSLDSLVEPMRNPLLEPLSDKAAQAKAVDNWLTQQKIDDLKFTRDRSRSKHESFMAIAGALAALAVIAYCASRAMAWVANGFLGQR